MAPTRLRVVWKCVSVEHGAQYVMTSGILLMLQLSATSWALDLVNNNHACMQLANMQCVYYMHVHVYISLLPMHFSVNSPIIKCCILLVQSAWEENTLL